MIDKTIKNIIKDKTFNKHEKLSGILYYLFVKIANISQKKYCILGSYAIRNHREINDLDINIDYSEFPKIYLLLQKNFGVLEIHNNQIRWFFDMTNEYNQLTKLNVDDFSIEAFQKLPTEGFPSSKFSLNYLKKIKGLDKDKNGHQFFNLKTLLAWKKQMNRPKDKNDIEIITNILHKK
jgi:hypothetical protein